MNNVLTALLLAGLGTLGACNSSPTANHQPISGGQPAAPATTATTATTAVTDTTQSAPAPRGTVPFVNPTKAGRVLGSQSPSPPASRTR